MKRSSLFFIALISLLPACAQPAQAPTPKTVYIRAGHLFDGTGDKTRENMVIVVLGDRIQSISPAGAVSIPTGATVVDLSHATVLPGLIDCHTHLGARADRYDEIYHFKNTPFQSAFVAVVNARKTLEAGFTSVRDVGSARSFVSPPLATPHAPGEHVPAPSDDRPPPAPHRGHSARRMLGRWRLRAARCR